MKLKLFLPWLLLSLTLAVTCACGGDDNEEPQVQPQPPTPTPTPQPQPETQRDAIATDVADAESQGIRIVSVDCENETMTVEATEEKAPRVGDFFYSGPTDEHPYGYRYRVTSVTKQESQTSRGLDDVKEFFYVLKLTAAAINEITKNLNISYTVPLDQIDLDMVTDNEGNQITVYEDHKREWRVPIKDLDIGDNISISPEIIIKPKAMTVDLVIKDHEMVKFGVNVDFDIDTSIRIDAKLKAKLEKKFSLFHYFLKPIPVCETPPIVVTPLIQAYFIFRADGKITLSCVPINDTFNANFGAYYDFQQEKVFPSKGEKVFNIKWNESKSKNLTTMEGALSVDGSLLSTLGASLSIGLNGCNYVGRVDFIKKLDFVADMVTIDYTLGVNHKLSAGLGIDNIDTEAYEDFHFSDWCKSEFYGDSYTTFYLRVWNPFKKEFAGFEPKTGGESERFWNFDLYPSLFIPEYRDVKLTLTDGNVLLNAAKYRPLFWNTLFKEQGHGFRFLKTSGDDDAAEWQTVPASSVIGNDDDPVWYINATIPKGSLERGESYIICPYSYMLTPSGSLQYLHRKGVMIRINDNGNITYNELPDIPGFNIN